MGSSQVCMMACSFSFLVYLDDGYFFAKCNACLECLQDKVFSHQRNSCSCVLRVQFASKTCQAILCHILTCSSGMMNSMIRKVTQQPPLSIRKLLIIGCGLCGFQNCWSACLQRWINHTTRLCPENQVQWYWCLMQEFLTLVSSAHDTAEGVCHSPSSDSMTRMLSPDFLELR